MVSRLPRRLAGALAAAALLVGACRGRSTGADEATGIQHLVDSLAPLIEESAGLAFREPPRWAVRTQDELLTFLQYKLDEQLPDEVLEGLQTAYALFGLVPDTLDLAPLFLSILSQQVQGFYEPDSTMLFLVEGAVLGEVVTLSHELVHALQDQYLPLDSLMDPDRPNDELMAIQAILEGQAQYVSMPLIAGDQVRSENFWDVAAEETRRATRQQLGHVPLILREALLFPYLDGARFLAWWANSPLADTLPYGPRLPVSTEQILFPPKYLAGEVPVGLAFADSSDAVLFQDGLGEFEIGVLRGELTGSDRALTDAPIGWNGDLFRVYRSAAGPALVWYSAWDNDPAATRFVNGTGLMLVNRTRAGYRQEIERLEVGGVPLLRVVLAPESWGGWDGLPGILVTP
jgi:hypothetical protein